MSARAIGNLVGASAEEINRILKDQGFLYGTPGAYGLTQKGETFGLQTSHERGTPGSLTYGRHWEQRSFDPSITAALDLSSETIARARSDIAADRLARAAARQAEAAEYFASRAAGLESTSRQIDLRKVAVLVVGTVVAAGVAVGGYAVTQSIRRRETKRGHGSHSPAARNANDQPSGGVEQA